ncbi:hypothetical protein GWN65_01900 [Candidatus Bathyarchaeota archaeon]|nr:hypothetical protein [Candidatus Bathyarchaeota archaeon]NIV43754.1 hypothetical protein [Candidatus Bathyarchaeota archaeon]
MIRPLDLLMLGGSILGERTTGTGIALWIVGMSILGIFAATLAVGKSRESAKRT